MLEGDAYPELRRMVMEPARMQLRQQLAPDWTRSDAFDAWRVASSEVSVVEAVKITMPKEDFERLMSIYTCHYHAASRNPAVADAWHQYRMLVALTERL